MHLQLEHEFGDMTNVLITLRPTFKDRDDLLRESQKQFDISDESAYSIVPSRMSMSIYTDHTTDSGASKTEENLVYKSLAFENELFTARVYKRNYRTARFQRLFKDTEQKTSEKPIPPTVPPENSKDPDISGGENSTIGEPGAILWRPTKAQSTPSVPTGGQPAGDEATGGEIIRSPNDTPSISFAKACEQGNVEVVETFLKSGTDVHARVWRNIDTSLGMSIDMSPIHLASKGGHIQVVEILLSYGADTEMLSLSLERPLHLAVRAGDPAMVRYLLDNGTNISARGGDTAQAIHVAAECGSTAILSLLLDRGAAIDSAMSDGAQALHIASHNSERANVIRFLCSRGADIEAKNYIGSTPLYYACLENAVDNMKALLELGAAHSPLGLSIFAIALDYGYLQAACLLLEHGLDPNRPVSGRPSALHRLAMFEGIHEDHYLRSQGPEMAELVLVCGADVNLQDLQGDTPLHCLCRRSKTYMPSVVQVEQQRREIQLANLLSEKMKDVDTVNSAGRTALGVSVEKGSSKWLIKPLIDSGSRLLLRKPHIELGLNLHQPPGGDLFYLDCYARRGSDTSIKRLGNYPEFFNDNPSILGLRMDILRRWLQDPEWDRWI